VIFKTTFIAQMIAFLLPPLLGPTVCQAFDPQTTGTLRQLMTESQILLLWITGKGFNGATSVFRALLFQKKMDCIHLNLGLPLMELPPGQIASQNSNLRKGRRALTNSETPRSLSGQRYVDVIKCNT
jgi:hypothetical protein